MTTGKVIAKKGSYKISVVEGESYYICSCGHSKNQPFCDGSHSDITGFEPIKYVASESKIVGFCGCKHSDKMPLCDGKHKIL